MLSNLSISEVRLGDLMYFRFCFCQDLSSNSSPMLEIKKIRWNKKKGGRIFFFSNLLIFEIYSIDIVSNDQLSPPLHKKEVNKYDFHQYLLFLLLFQFFFQRNVFSSLLCSLSSLSLPIWSFQGQSQRGCFDTILPKSL